MTFDNNTRVSVVADSVSDITGDRLTSFEVVAHRFILAEINTHCAFERNSASSRAIPLRTQLTRFVEAPALPVSMPAEKPGMSGGAELEGTHRIDADDLLDVLHASVGLTVMRYLADHMDPKHRLHKSVVSRYLEPFQWHRMVITGSAWENFFAQRCQSDAQPEFRIIAEMMRDRLGESNPVSLRRGEWHLPYVNAAEDLEGEDARKVSAARCARVSYMARTDGRVPKDDALLCDGLVANHHWSPLAHVATPEPQNVQVVSFRDPDRFDSPIDTDSGVPVTRRVPIFGKWAGWQQYRHIVEARTGWDSNR